MNEGRSGLPAAAVEMGVIDAPQPSSVTVFGGLGSLVEPGAAQRLLDAAIEEFAARGYHATTTRAIADRVGMSPAALYVHFPSKHAVLFAIVRACHEVALADVRAAISNARDAPGEQLHAAVKAFVSWHGLHPMAARVGQSELRSLDDAAFESIKRLRRALEEVVEDIIAAGQESGEFDKQLGVPDAARAILSLGIDLSRWYRAGGGLAPSEIGALYAEFAQRMVRLPEQALHRAVRP